jgi:SAM-dependent methyltransferase
VLDVGCGSGENALFLATLGAAVVGIDVAETALGRGRDSARDRGLDVEFFYADALALERLQRTFETVLDCGLFHTFDAAERARYAASVASVTEPGGTLHVLCFSDEGPDTGPHPVTHDELRATFSDDAGWAIESIGRERLMTRFHGENGVSAWLATMKRR